MREGIYRFLEIAAGTLDLLEPILEIGPAALKNERFGRLVVGRSYFTLDADPALRPSLVGDAMTMPVRDSSVGTVVVCEVLEHVRNPFDVAAEITRVMKPNGLCVASTPYDLPIHNFPRDFFRPSPDALSFLFSSLPCRIIGYQGRPEFPHTSFFLGFKREDLDCATISSRLERELRIRMHQNRWRWMGSIPHFRHNPYVRSLTYFNNFHFESCSEEGCIARGLQE